METSKGFDLVDLTNIDEDFDVEKIINGNLQKINQELVSIDETFSKGVPIPPISLSFDNITVVKTGKEPSEAVVEFTPTSYVNITGRDGNCEDASKWTARGTTLALDSSKKVFGANSIKITTTGSGGDMFKALSSWNIDPTKYYLVSAYLDKGNATSITLGKDTSGGGISKTVSSTAIAPTRSAFKMQPSDFNANNLLTVYVDGTAKYGFVDGIQINEINSSEYTNDSVETLMARYPYVDSLAVTKNPTVEITHADGSKSVTVIKRDCLKGDNVKLVGKRTEGTVVWSNKKNLDGNLAWNLHGINTTFAQIRLDNFIPDVKNSLGARLAVKWDGKQFTPTAAQLSAADQIFDGDLSVRQNVYISVAHSDSGWVQAIAPNGDEMKANRMGWKAIANDGTRYVGFISQSDFSSPSSATTTGVTTNSSGTKTLTVANGNLFSTGDYVSVHNKLTGVSVMVDTVASVTATSITLVSGTPTVTTDFIVTKCKDNTGRSLQIDYCSKNKAPNYEPDYLYYQYSQPITITDENRDYHATVDGDGAWLREGTNVVKVDTGRALDEPVVPTTNGPYAYINTLDSAKLKNPVEYINIVKTNGSPDSLWSWVAGFDKPRGNGIARKDVNVFNPSATYTADYTMLRTEAPQIGTATLKCSEGLVAFAESVAVALEGKQDKSVVLDTIAENGINEKMSMLNESRWTKPNTSTAFTKASVNVFYSTKIVKPKAVSVKIQVCYALDGAGSSIQVPTADLVGYASYVSKTNCIVSVEYRGSNSTVQTYLLNNGGSFYFDLELDCKGVI